MAAIDLSECTIYRKSEGDVETIYVATPATADSADTLDLSSIIDSRNIVGVNCWDRADGAVATITESSGDFTLDAAGGATNSVYVVKIEVAR